MVTEISEGKTMTSPAGSGAAKDSAATNSGTAAGDANGGAAADSAAAVQMFEAHRGLLFSIAYRMLGRASEAEDVVQDAWLRFTSTPPPEALRSPRAWLGTIVTRLCLDRLKAAHTTREQYVGPWLPEPVIHADREPSLARAVEQHESITLAFLVLLEALTPQERAVFVLREAFDYDYEEIGEMLQLTPANCRQLFHRARRRVAEHRPRFRPSPARHRALVDSFVQAVHGGNLDRLRALLTEDVLCRTDGGGKIAAASRPFQGATAVARFLLNIERLHRDYAQKEGIPARTMTTAMVNGQMAVLVRVGRALDSVFTIHTERDVITGIDIVRNPEKLAYVIRELGE
jgi:RNA polymerase sigma-70 factor (ECF subfamily)